MSLRAAINAASGNTNSEEQELVKNKNDPASLSALGSIVPDRDSFRKDLLSVLPGQFHGHLSSSTSQLDGLVRCTPGCAPPLPLTQPSGLARPQFMVATQAASLPCFPSHCHADGGLVLDRVLLAAGANSWWTTLTGRVKAQRILTAYKAQGWRTALSNPASYGLCSNLSATLPDGLLLRTRATFNPQAAEVTAIPTIAEHSDDTNHSLQLGNFTAPQWLEHLVKKQHKSFTAAATLRRKLRHAEFRADVGINDPLLFSSEPPLVHASVDLRTPSNQLDTIQYRLGVQHVVLPGDSTGSSGGSRKAEGITHLQGAIALQGQHMLWCGNASKRRASNTRKTSRHAGGRTNGGGASTAFIAEEGAAGLPGITGLSVGGTNNGLHPRGKVLGPHNPIRQVLQKLLRPGGATGQDGRGDDDDDSVTSAAQKMFGIQGLIPGVGNLPQPEEVQETLIDATQSIKRLREDVQSLTGWVLAGGFREQLEKAGGTGLTGNDKHRRTGLLTAVKQQQQLKEVNQNMPWSSLVGTPQLKLAGLFGLYVRQPLWSGDGPGPASGRFPTTSQSTTPRPTSNGGNARLVDRANSLSADLVRSSVAWLASACSGSQQGISRPHGFASLGASAQFGWFQRPVLDFTRATARLDLGLPGSPMSSTSQVGDSAGSPATFAWLADPLPCWHALSLSFVQQLVGPLRLCADLRYSLDLSKRLPNPPSLGALSHQDSIRARAQQIVSRRLRGAAERVQGARTQLIDAVVGLDVVVPGTSGFARLVAWYAMQRGEAMVELRLL